MKPGKKYYRQIVKKLKKEKRAGNQYWGANYLGSKRASLNLPAPLVRKILKKFSKDHQDLSLAELVELLDYLYQGRYIDEKQAGGKLLQCYPQLRPQLKLEKVDQWLEELIGWAEIDSLCQSVFTAKEMEKNWLEWQKWLKAWSRDKNISKRRASLVFLTAAVRQSQEKKFSQLALDLIDKLKKEKEILITKAVSWLLREMVKHHRQTVAEYLEKNQNSLPKIAVRETKNKLRSGKKS